MGRFVWASLLALTLSGRDDKEDVKNAAKKLTESGYSWTSTPKSDGGGQGGRTRGTGPVDGKIDKEGWTLLSTKSGETAIEAALKGEKAAVKSGEEWKTPDEFPQGGGGGGQRDPAAGFARGLKAFKAPADQVANLVDKVAELKKGEDGLYSGDFTEEGAKELLSGGGAAGRAPTVTEPKGSVKFWVKDGALVKYETTLTGKMTFGQGGQARRAPYVTVRGPKDGATAPGGRSCYLSSRRCPFLFDYRS